MVEIWQDKFLIKILIFTLFSNTITMHSKSITKDLENVIFNLISS